MRRLGVVAALDRRRGLPAPVRRRRARRRLRDRSPLTVRLQRGRPRRTVRRRRTLALRRRHDRDWPAISHRFAEPGRYTSRSRSTTCSAAPQSSTTRYAPGSVPAFARPAVVFGSRRSRTGGSSRPRRARVVLERRDGPRGRRRAAGPTRRAASAPGARAARAAPGVRARRHVRSEPVTARRLAPAARSPPAAGTAFVGAPVVVARASPGRRAWRRDGAPRSASRSPSSQVPVGQAR